jgi:hypothetical protein
VAILKLTFYKNIIFTKAAPFPNTYNHASFKENEVGGAIDVAVAHVRTSAMLLLHTVGIRKIEAGGRSNGITFIPSFVNVGPIPRAKWGTKRNTQHNDLIRLLFFSFVGKKSWVTTMRKTRSVWT